jgi:hypothetical protein
VQRAEARRPRRAGAGGGAARRPLAVPGIAGDAVQRAIARRLPAELGGGGLADDDGARRLEPSTAGASSVAGSAEVVRLPRRVGKPAMLSRSFTVRGRRRAAPSAARRPARLALAGRDTARGFMAAKAFTQGSTRPRGASPPAKPPPATGRARVEGEQGFGGHERGVGRGHAGPRRRGG